MSNYKRLRELANNTATNINLDTGDRLTRRADQTVAVYDKVVTGGGSGTTFGASSYIGMLVTGYETINASQYAHAWSTVPHIMARVDTFSSGAFHRWTGHQFKNISQQTLVIIDHEEVNAIAKDGEILTGAQWTNIGVGTDYSRGSVVFLKPDSVIGIGNMYSSYSKGAMPIYYKREMDVYGGWYGLSGDTLSTELEGGTLDATLTDIGYNKNHFRVITW